MLPESRSVWLVASSAMEVRPVPGTKVEKTRPSAAGVSLVRKPEVAPGVEGMMLGTSAFSVGKPKAEV
jgi:hypothetical protein